MNSTNCRDRPLMSEAQVIPCGRLDLLAESLRQVRESSNVVILSCVTNFITSSAESVSSVSNRVEPILRQFSHVLDDVAKSHPETLFLISPPMYRSFPLWYRDGVSEILQKFSSMMCSKPSGVPNVHLLPSFPTPSFEADGIHLTPYSGLEFILHLFDSSTELIKTLSSRPEEVVIRNVESSRVLEDRVMVLEQDHRRLNKAFEDKFAEDAELADYHENTRYEDHFIVHGLEAIPKCDPKIWQDKAKRIIRDFLVKLIEREVKVVFVKNITGKAKDSIPRYQVQMESVALSREIRDKFGTFFPGGKDSRPDPFKGVSVRNRLTHVNSLHHHEDLGSALERLEPRVKDSVHQLRVKANHQADQRRGRGGFSCPSAHLRRGREDVAHLLLSRRARADLERGQAKMAWQTEVSLYRSFR